MCFALLQSRDFVPLQSLTPQSFIARKSTENNLCFENMAYHENPAEEMHFGDLELTYFKRRYYGKVGPKTSRSGPQ